MARNRRRNTHPDERDTSDIASDHLSELLRPSLKIKHTAPVAHPSPTKILKNTLRQIEDRRTYHPQADKRPARSLNRSQHSLVIRDKKTSPRLSHQVQFDAPKRVLICIRRKMRKEVLFAKSKTGKGARARRHQRNYYSEVTC